MFDSMQMKLFGIFLTLFQLTSQAEVSIARVVGVSDGDTITVLSLDKKQSKIRLDSIDAPEKNQDFGQASKKYLSSLIFKKQISYESHKIDKYGRTVALVWADNKSVNLEMVKAGMAWVYRKYSDDPVFFEAEEQAKTNRLGLWSQPDPTPPWDFRHPNQSPTIQTQLTSADKNSCGDKHFCKQMTSCDEAKHYLHVCGIQALDKDGDGVPCEKLCK